MEADTPHEAQREAVGGLHGHCSLSRSVVSVCVCVCHCVCDGSESMELV